MEIVKKIGKAFLKLILIILILLLLTAAVLFVIRRVNLPKNRQFLTETGYLNPASAGDISLNCVFTGNENGAHRIVFLSGAGPCYLFSTKEFAQKLQQENQVIYLARPGYDGSDDTKEPMTADFVVECYRKALESAGVQKPYVLMPHSLGSLYASYWVSKYPDEIEAVANIDGTPAALAEDGDNGSGMKLVHWLANLGVGDVAFHAFILKDARYSETEQKAFDICYVSTLASDALISEGKLIAQNQNAVWNALTPNDVPKLYITTHMGFRTEEELDETGYLSDWEINDLTPDFTGSDADRKALAYQNFLKDCRTYEENTLMPFLEKLGSCELAYLPGDHFIYEEKPAETADIILDFLDTLT